jgi:hypothetical protein
MRTTVSPVIQATPAVDAAGKQAVAGILREIHRMWLAEVRQWVAPAMAPEADFWDGWSAVRYLNDQFDRQYRRKQTFLKAVLPRFNPAELLALREKTAHLVRGVRELNSLGRRQGQGRAVATASARLLELLEGWFAETRRLVRGLSTGELPLQGRRALAELHAALATRAS